MSVLSRRLARMAGYALIVILLLLVVTVSATVGWRPLLGPRMRPVTSRRFEATPARMQRGQYLVENVSLCFGCHTRFDAKGKDVPVFLAGKGSGRVMVNDGDFKVVAPNITPDTETGIRGWSDDEIARAIREGVSRNGRALFPIMPYGNFRKMSDEDVASIVVYLRAQRPVRNDPGRTTLPFPVSRLINTAPQPVNGLVTAPDPSDAVRYGEYLANAVGDCNGCHTPRDKHGQDIPGMMLGGGNPFDDSGVTVVSANITPDPSGIAYYDEASFVSVMRTGQVRGRQAQRHDALVGVPEHDRR